MAHSTYDVPTDSASSSCFPSGGSSVGSESSETSHSTFARKSHGDTGVVQVATGNNSGNGISTSEHQSSDIFSLSDQQLSDKLRFVKEVGFGNWGSVWLCEPRLAEEREQYGPQIAVKLVHRSKTPTTAARVRSLWNEMKIVRALRREASASGSTQDLVGVGHPSVVQFHSFVITPSYALITMQYLPTPVPVEVPEFRAKTWFYSLTDGLSFLHQRGVVHNDIKPANILLTGTSPPTPVLVDFGFAEHYTLTSRHAFQSNLAYGTPEYLAPERARGQPHDTRKSDVYALGVTFFEILVGRTPFEEVEGESFVSKEDLERYWARTVKGKWIGKWEGIMSKQCEKALKRMTLPNADLRVTATDVLNDPYFRGEEESRSNLSVDLSVLSEIMPPWSRPTLSQSKAKAHPSMSTSDRPRTADKESAQPIKSETVKSRGGTFHRTSKSITEAFRKSVGASKKAPKKTAAEAFGIDVSNKPVAESTPILKEKTSSAMLKRRVSAAVLKEKKSATVLKEKNSVSVLREKSLKPKDSTRALKEKKSGPLLKEQRSTTFALAPKKEKEPAQDKENVKPKGHTKTLSMTLSFSRSFGRKKAKELDENAEPPMEKRRSMYFIRSPAPETSPITGADAPSPTTPTTPTTPVTRTISPSSAATPYQALNKTGTAPPRTSPPVPPKSHARAPSNPRDVRTLFAITPEPSTPSDSTAPSQAAQTISRPTSSRSIVFAVEPKDASSGSVRSRQALYDRTHSIEPNSQKEPATPKPNTLRSTGTPRLTTIAQSPSNSAKASAATPTKTRVSRIAAKENRRTTVVARGSPAKPRGTPVKAKPSPTRVRASPAAPPRTTKVPVFAIGPKANNAPGSKVTVKKDAAKVLRDSTNVNGSVRSKKVAESAKKSLVKAEEANDEGDDTITLPVEVFRNSALPRMSKGSSTSIIKQSIRQSFDKAVRFGRASVSATESSHFPASECTQPRRSLSVGEAWDNDAADRLGARYGLDAEQTAAGNPDDRMAIWIRGVEKVVEDARQSFQVGGDPTPLPLPPPPPRLNHSQSAGLTRISTSAKDPTIRTLTSDANPSVTTFAGAPQAPVRSRRATVGSITPPSTAVSFTTSTPVPQGRLSRPITPCLNAELGKEPTTITSPRLSEVLDSDSRKLILAGTPDDTLVTRSLRTPSPSNDHSRTSLSTMSRPATSMSAMRPDVNPPAVDMDYEQFLLSQASVVRNGKGYQSDFTLRGKGIEHIPSNSNLQSKRDGKVFRAFKTMVSGGVKKRVPLPLGSPVFVGGGFGTSMESSWAKTVKSAPRSWSRAQAV